MLKNKILEQLGTVLDKWLLGFNKKDDFNVSMFSTEKLNLKNAIINPNAVNEILRESNSPMLLKCGMIGKISLKVSFLLSLLTAHFYRPTL